MREGGIDGGAIGLGRRGNVMGTLEPALDFEGADSCLDECSHLFNRGQILRAEQIGTIAELVMPTIDDHLIGKSASLGTLAPVGASSAERFAGEALPGVSHAARAVYEHLYGQFRLLRDFPNVFNTQFSREDDWPQY